MRLCPEIPGKHDEAGPWHLSIAVKGLQARGPGQEVGGRKEPNPTVIRPFSMPGQQKSGERGKKKQKKGEEDKREPGLEAASRKEVWS